MATIVTRSGKGSPLTHAEVDANFTNLNTDKLELSGGTMTGNLEVQGTVTADGLTVDGNVASITLNNTDTTIGQQRLSEINFDQNDPDGAGVGTVASIYALNRGSSSGFGALVFQTGTASSLADRMRIEYTGDISFYEDTGTTAKFFWDASAESLGIGTTSPQRIIHTKSSVPAIRLEDSDVSGLYHEIVGTASGEVQFKVDAGNVQANSDLSFVLDATERMRIDSSGNVGIGTSSPSSPLTIAQSADNDLNGLTGIRVDAAGATNNRYLGLGIYDTQGVVLTAGSSDTSSSTIAFRTAASGAEAERMRIDSSGNVGIGTSSPATKLDVNGSAYIRAGSILGLYNTDNTNQYQIYNGGSSGANIGQLIFTQGGVAERMRIDSSGNVGIGTSSPSSFNSAANNLVVGTGSGDQGISIYAGSDSDSSVFFVDGYSGTSQYRAQMKYRHDVDSFSFHTNGGFERMRIDSSGNVGIGGSAVPSTTSYNSATLHLRQAGSSSVGSQLRFTNGNSGHTNTDGGFISYWTDNNFYFNNQETGDFRFFSGGSERMRLDSSGNLLVGKSVTTFNTAGTRLSGVDGAHITRSGGASLNLNRLSSDGDILGFYKDGSTVGSIGTNAGYLKINSGNTSFGSGIEFHNLKALPVGANGASSNGTVDLGENTRRWKDLYLSGGVYLGGVGSANKLDDYEEGTWTPDVVGTTTAGAGTYNSRAGRYTKIGDRVLFNCWINMSSHTGSGNLAINGLPFTSASGNNFHSLNAQYSSALTAPAGSFIVGMLFNSSSQIALYSIPTGTTTSTALALDTGFVLNISGQYLAS